MFHNYCDVYFTEVTTYVHVLGYSFNKDILFSILDLAG